MQDFQFGKWIHLFVSSEFNLLHWFVIPSSVSFFYQEFYSWREETDFIVCIVSPFSHIFFTKFNTIIQITSRGYWQCTNKYHTQFKTLCEGRDGTNIFHRGAAPASSEKNMTACFWWQTFEQPEKRSYFSWRWLLLWLSKHKSPTLLTVLLRITLTQMPSHCTNYWYSRV